MTSLGITMMNDYIGPIKSEKIVQGMNIVSSTNIFMRADGSYWSGPVHEHNGIFMEGSYHTDAAHGQLTRRSVVNTKIKDKRNMIETKHSTSQMADNFMSKLFVYGCSFSMGFNDFQRKKYPIYSWPFLLSNHLKHPLVFRMCMVSCIT